ncbi:hypothetical protein COC54_14295 [Bacillus pseudomycoides]|nr:hypothetical protein CN564_22795 [Bacillus pseudomycoides]PGS04221.1 hypothetical protein COC54_14295 [Bacillus pseudomycoides]PHC92575.1 hypothetical protein COF36_19325 [Bacillus pseudomycoides]
MLLNSFHSSIVQMFLNKKLTDFIGNNTELRKPTRKRSYNLYDEDFILVGDDLEVGVCIERTEYHYQFSM